jgi:hypothetical protein
LTPKPGGRKRKGAGPAGKKSADREPHAPPARSAGTVRARKLKGQQDWELIHPRCARDREEDLEEVRKMLEAGEVDVAVDECRWLLGGCSDCLEAHRILGEIALAEHDLPLARGHFGYAYRLGVKALAEAHSHGPLPYRLPANRSFLESAKALAWCLKQLGKGEMAGEVVKIALQCDPSDPLGLKSVTDEPLDSRGD